MPRSRVIARRYELVREIGRGGMGEVHSALDLNTQRTVALKVLAGRLAGDPRAEKRFRQEALAMSRLEHPHVVRVYDFGETAEGDAFLVMELVEARTLAALLATEGALDPARVVAIGTQIARALVAAHAEGIVHRDLKPSNVLVQDLYGERDFVRVTDFGVARLVGEPTLESQEHLVGTPHYASPEQAQGGAVDQRSDLYSLGVLLFEAATGQRPFSAATPMGVLYQHVHARPTRPRDVVPDLPPRLEELLLALLEKEPERRPQRALDVVERLREAVDTNVARATPLEGIAPAGLRPHGSALEATSDTAIELPLHDRRRAQTERLRPLLFRLGAALVAVIALVLLVRPQRGTRAEHEQHAAGSAAATSVTLAPAREMAATLPREEALHLRAAPSTDATSALPLPVPSDARPSHLVPHSTSVPSASSSVRPRSAEAAAVPPAATASAWPQVERLTPKRISPNRRTGTP